MLRHLASKPGRVFSRRELLELVRDYEALDQDEKTINVHVSHLREKLEDDPVDSHFILTIRGAGYAFAERWADGRRIGQRAEYPPGLRAVASSYRTRLFMASCVVAVVLGLVLRVPPRLLEGFFLDQERENSDAAKSMATILAGELRTAVRRVARAPSSCQLGGTGRFEPSGPSATPAVVPSTS